MYKIIYFNRRVSRLEGLQIRLFLIFDRLRDIYTGLSLIVRKKRQLYYCYENRSIVYINGLDYIMDVKACLGEQSVIEREFVDYHGEIKKSRGFYEYFGEE
jgi:hypothetical protein